MFFGRGVIGLAAVTGGSQLRWPVIIAGVPVLPVSSVSSRSEASFSRSAVRRRDQAALLMTGLRCHCELNGPFSAVAPVIVGDVDFYLGQAGLVSSSSPSARTSVWLNYY